MNTAHSRNCRKLGFTLMEVIIAAAVSAMMFAALAGAAVSLYKSFAASDHYSTAKSHQIRAIDYIVRDLRAAIKVTLTANSEKLEITLPDYYQNYDAQGNPTGPPVTPTFDGTTVNYGDPLKPVVVSYYVEGKSLIREIYVGKKNTRSKGLLGEGVTDFKMAFGQLDSIVNVNITFASRFKGNTQPLNAATRLSAAVSVRNVARN